MRHSLNFLKGVVKGTTVRVIGGAQEFRLIIAHITILSAYIVLGGWQSIRVIKR